MQHLGCDKKVQFFAQYLIELSMIDNKILQHKPSVIAAAAIYFANRMINKDKNWNIKMGKKTHYMDFDLKVPVKELMILMQLSEKSTLKAIKKKYSNAKYLEVSKLSFKKKVSP